MIVATIYGRNKPNASNVFKGERVCRGKEVSVWRHAYDSYTFSVIGNDTNKIYSIVQPSGAFKDNEAMKIKNILCPKLSNADWREVNDIVRNFADRVNEAPDVGQQKPRERVKTGFGGFDRGSVPSSEEVKPEPEYTENFGEDRKNLVLLAVSIIMFMILISIFIFVFKD